MSFDIVHPVSLEHAWQNNGYLDYLFIYFNESLVVNLFQKN